MTNRHPVFDVSVREGHSDDRDLAFDVSVREGHCDDK